MPLPAVDETLARRLSLLRAVETDDGAAAGLWTPEDRQWATRLARDSAGAGAPPERVLAERAAHAAQRLRSRHPAVAAWLDQRTRLGPWLLAAGLLALLAGLLVDQIGASQRVNLLAPPVWLLVGWNLLVYVGMALQPLWPPAIGPALRRRLQALWTPRSSGLMPQLQAQWMLQSAALNGARAALLLHLAAAALAAGVVAGLYLRGLVLDYRAGWQSTFLDAAAVHTLLAALLAPAQALTGITLPGTEALAALQLRPGQDAAGPAAPWLHLYAATLLLAVIGPRLLLALLAAWRVHRLSRRWTLPGHDTWLQQQLRVASGGWVLPHAVPLAAASALGLRALLAPVLGDDLQLQPAVAVAHGDEDQPPPPPPGTTLALLLVDATATPEDDVHGRLLQASAAPGLRRLLVLDEAAFVQRFGATSPRRAERRQAWQALAAAQGLPLLAADLARPAPADAEAWRRTLERA
jgi:xanthosine utilization system XapX-like protein